MKYFYCAAHTATERAFSCDSEVLLGPKSFVGYQFESLVHKLSAAVCAPHTATEKAFSCDSMVLLGSKIIVGIGYQFMSPWYTNLVPGAYAGPWSPAHSFVFW